MFLLGLLVCLLVGWFFGWSVGSVCYLFLVSWWWCEDRSLEIPSPNNELKRQRQYHTTTWFATRSFGRKVSVRTTPLHTAYLHVVRHTLQVTIDSSAVFSGCVFCLFVWCRCSRCALLLFAWWSAFVGALCFRPVHKSRCGRAVCVCVCVPTPVFVVVGQTMVVHVAAS